MKNNITRFFKRFIHQPSLPYVLILSIVFVCIALLNFPYGKWLIGWDNVLPELNFHENLKRGIFSTWQENEGLGLTGGHGFATTVIHTLFLWGMSFIAPLNYLRPIFHLLMLYIGALGAFYLTVKVLSTYKHRHILGLVSGLFYMTNFGTVQMFYIPLEAFSAHFAFLPWLLLTLINVIEKRSIINVITFTGVSLLSTMQGFIPPLFIVYGLFFAIIAFSFIVKTRTKQAIMNVIIAGLITLTVNAYWLLPIGYYTINNSHVYLNSYNNKTTTDEFILKNQEYGNVQALVQLKGFISQSMDTSDEGQAEQIFSQWNSYSNHPFIVMLAYITFGIILIGLGTSLWKGTWVEQSFASLFLIIFTFLATDVPGFAWFSDILRNHAPIFKQAFRIAFTKFIIAMALTYGIFFVLGLRSILQLIEKKYYKTYLSYIVGGVAVLILLTQFFPIFRGGFFYDRTRIELPQEYLELFEFFQNQDHAERIANFPQPIPTGWSVYRWGYSGSGFLWYGLPQPILDRNFDVWSNHNENYYWEVSRAVYAQEPDDFLRVMQKYNVTWILIDENVTSYTPYRTLFYDRLKQMLTELPEIQETREFGRITVYRLDTNRQTIQLISNPPAVGPQYAWGNNDLAFANNPLYITTDDNDTYYPYRSLFSGRGADDMETRISKEEDYYVFPMDIPDDWSKGTLVIPPFNPNEFYERDIEDLTLVRNSLPVMRVNGEMSILYLDNASVQFSPQDDIEILIPEVMSYNTYNSRIVPNEFIGREVDCAYQESDISQNSQRLRNNIEETFIRFRAVDSISCRSVYLSTLDHEMAYIVAVYSRNVDGTPIKFWVENSTTKRADQIVYLEKNPEFHWEYFIIPPMAEDGLGYTLHFDNLSIGRVESMNDLAEVKVQPIPYRFFTEMYLGIENNSPIEATNISYEKKNYTYYQASLESEIDEGDTLVLYQGFDPGWKAYVNGKELSDHVRINNWANGWQLNSNIQPPNSIVVIYWPQYLQYIGLGLLGVTLLGIIGLVFFRLIRRNK